MSEALERACQFSVAEWLDEAGDMQTKEPDEERSEERRVGKEC